jgi:serine protease Do
LKISDLRVPFKIPVRFTLSRRFIPAVLLLVAGFVAGILLNDGVRSATESRGDASPAPATAPAPIEQAPAAPRAAPAAPSVPSAGPDFTRIAAQTVKGVVNISSLQVVRRRNSPFLDDPFFNYFFGDQDIFGSRDRRSLSLGSGVIVSADGYVVTNNHVVGENQNATREVTVALGDKREIKGTIVGTDPATDIAVLKINVKGLPVIPWGDSSKLQVGEWVLAIGSPFQLSQTVTAGIVSATGRANIGFTDYEDFIQTDAAINPGNSGGALINTRGELIGINTGIYSQSGGYQGIGFAIPSVLARHIVDDLMQFGEVRRGTISGITRIEALTPELARELGAPDTSGALVYSITRSSDRLIRPGDIIVRFNSQPVQDPSQLFRLVADAKIGSTATLQVIRDGRRVDLKVAIVSTSRSQR